MKQNRKMYRALRRDVNHGKTPEERMLEVAEKCGNLNAAIRMVEIMNAQDAGESAEECLAELTK